jgi:hypothetical protein
VQSTCVATTTFNPPSTVNACPPLLYSSVLQARSSGRDETDIGSSRLGVLCFGRETEPRRPLEGSPGETALVDRFDAPRWGFRAEG